MIGSHFKGHVVHDWAKEHDTEWRFHLPCNLHAAGLIKWKNGILKQQINLLTSKTTLAELNNVLSQALIHLSDQPVGPIAPYARLGTPAEAPHTVNAPYLEWNTYH